MSSESKFTVLSQKSLPTPEGIEKFTLRGGASYKIWYHPSAGGEICRTPLCETLADCVDYLIQKNELVGFVHRQDARIWALEVAAMRAQQRLDALVAVVTEISRPNADDDVAVRMAKIHSVFSDIAENKSAQPSYFPPQDLKAQRQAVRNAVRALSEPVCTPADLRAVRTKAFYTVEMPVSDFSNVARHEFECASDRDTIVTRLGNVDGVSQIEYDGHFGPAIFFALDDDCAQNMAECIEIIGLAIEAANAFVNSELVRSPE